MTDLVPLVIHAGYLEPGDRLLEGVVAAVDIDRKAAAFGPWPLTIRLEDGRLARTTSATKVHVAELPRQRAVPRTSPDGVEDLTFEAPPAEDWFVRCPAVYDAAGPDRLEQCAYPSLDSPEWYMHDDFHETRTWSWGSTEVRAAKERRRSEAAAAPASPPDDWLTALRHRIDQELGLE